MTAEKGERSYHTMMMEASDWGAVRGEQIVAKGGTKEQARRAADHLGEEYWEIIALPPAVGFI